MEKKTIGFSKVGGFQNTLPSLPLDRLGLRFSHGPGMTIKTEPPDLRDARRPV